jgi:hypothetical protein
MNKKQKPKDIVPTDEYGRLHGYCEEYYDDSGLLSWFGVCVHGRWCGYVEDYYFTGVLDIDTGYWINDCKISSDNAEGYCYVWNKEEA